MSRITRFSIPEKVLLAVISFHMADKARHDTVLFFVFPRRLANAQW